MIAPSKLGVLHPNFPQAQLISKPWAALSGSAVRWDAGIAELRMQRGWGDFST